MTELSEFSLRKPLFYPVKLYPGDPCESNNQSDKQNKGFYWGKIGIFRRLIGAVYEQYNDEVYEIAKHKNIYLNMKRLIRWTMLKLKSYSFHDRYKCLKFEMS